MGWQLSDPEFRAAIVELMERLGGRCALAGTVGAQIHLAAAIGLDKRGPPAHGIDVVMFGHSHEPLNEKNGGVLYFNPGSPNDKVFAPYCSYGILDISEKGIIGKIIKVKDG